MTHNKVAYTIPKAVTYVLTEREQANALVEFMCSEGYQGIIFPSNNGRVVSEVHFRWRNPHFGKERDRLEGVVGLTLMGVADVKVGIIEENGEKYGHKDYFKFELGILDHSLEGVVEDFVAKRDKEVREYFKRRDMDFEVIGSRYLLRRDLGR